MSSLRPLISVYGTDASKSKENVLTPGVFCSPLRPDLVRYVVTNMAKNKRQAYGVATNAGYQTSAQSWGTGRAVSRIPRVPGGGTHRAGQGAFGNMCRGGGMFNPNKTWRRWHRSINVNQKRYAVASSIAASGIPPLVMARGHRIDQVPEIPLVVSDKVQSLTKTKDAVQCLTALGLSAELEKVRDSKKLRAGAGKNRNRRYVKRKGPLVIYQHDNGLTKAFRNIPGVDLCHVDRLNLLKLAPGGSIGRLCLWSKEAFRRLQKLYGPHTGTGSAQLKKGYHLPYPIMKNADLGRVINSRTVQTVLKPRLLPPRSRSQHKNLLTNRSARCKVNPAFSKLATIAKIAKKVSKTDPKRIQKKIQKSQMYKESHKRSLQHFRNMVSEWAAKRKIEDEKSRVAREMAMKTYSTDGNADE